MQMMLIIMQIIPIIMNYGISSIACTHRLYRFLLATYGPFIVIILTNCYPLEIYDQKILVTNEFDLSVTEKESNKLAKCNITWNQRMRLWWATEWARDWVFLGSNPPNSIFVNLVHLKVQSYSQKGHTLLKNSLATKYFWHFIKNLQVLLTSGRKYEDLTEEEQKCVS